MALYQNKYRVETTRLKHWDYSRDAAYFITICTANSISFFGKIEDDKMQYSPIGQIVANTWTATPSIRPDMNLTLGAFVVMPNHFHAIVIIGQNEHNELYASDGENTKFHSTPSTAPSKNLAAIVRGFKAKVTSTARKINSDFAWQPRYHDHIIRNEQAFERISNYIQNNPILWRKDKFYNL